MRVKRVRYGKKEMASLMEVIQNRSELVQIKNAMEVVEAAGKKTDQAAIEAVKATPTTLEGLTMTKSEELTSTSEGLTSTSEELTSTTAEGLTPTSEELTSTTSEGLTSTISEELTPTSEGFTPKKYGRMSLKVLKKVYGHVPKWFHQRKLERLKKFQKIWKARKNRIKVGHL